MTFNDMLGSLSWDVIIMFAVTLPVCGAMGTAETGIMVTVMAKLTPIFNGLSPMAFIIKTIIGLCAITRIAHNLVLT